VSETAPTDTTVKPAPPVDPELPPEVPDAPFDEDEQHPPQTFEEGDDGKAKVIIPEHLKNDVSLAVSPWIDT